MGFTNRKNKARKNRANAVGVDSGWAEVMDTLIANIYKAGVMQCMAVLEKKANRLQEARKFFLIRTLYREKGERLRTQILKGLDNGNTVAAGGGSLSVSCGGRCSTGGDGGCGQCHKMA